MFTSHALTIKSLGNGDRSAPYLPAHLEVSVRPRNDADGQTQRAPDRAITAGYERLEWPSLNSALSAG